MHSAVLGAALSAGQAATYLLQWTGSTSWRGGTVLQRHCILHSLPLVVPAARVSFLLQRVMNFSDEQNQDNILVRQAYLHKIGQLMRARQRLTAQLTGALPSGSRWGYADLDILDISEAVACAVARCRAAPALQQQGEAC